MEEFEVIGSDNIEPIIVASLTWESFEQFSLWKLMDAEYSQNHIAIEELFPKLVPRYVHPGGTLH